jgi:hypothetical protein
MSAMQKIKIEPVCDDNNCIESIDCIVNNIKQEPEVEFVLILPPRQVKVEKFEALEVQEQTQSVDQTQSVHQLRDVRDKKLLLAFF